MRSTFPPGLAVLASVNLVFATLFAAHSSAQDAEDALRVTITSAQGRERHPHSRGGTVGWVGLRSEQRVSITLQLPRSYAGQVAMIGPLDGGQVIARDNLLVSADGKVQCSFQAGATLGLYRVSAQIGTEQYFLQFYVIDPDHPETNPARVRIAD
jgi:hypothetical protein